MNSKPPHLSVDELISLENRTRRSYEQSGVPPTYPVIRVASYLSGNKLLPFLLLGSIVLLIASTAFALTAFDSGDDRPIGLTGQDDVADERIAYGDVYGMDHNELPESQPESRSIEGEGRTDATGGSRDIDDPEIYRAPSPNKSSNQSQTSATPVSGDSIPDSTPPPTPPSTSSPSSPSSSSTDTVVSVASWNANYNNEVARVVRHVKGINADVIGLQEMGGKAHARSIIRGLTNCSRCGYAAYMPTGHNAHAIPILWKKARFKLLATGSFQVNEAQVIKDGGSRTNLLDKSSNWVKLRERSTGFVFYLSNNHLVPSVELKGRPYPGRQKRLAMFYEHMDGIVKTVNKARRQGIPILVTGDFNVNYRLDSKERTPKFPYARFKAVGVFANWYHIGKSSGGTHRASNRLIDYVHATKTKKLRALSQKVMAKGGSDHSPVFVKFRLKR